jgi:hypothetical protein
MMEAPMKSDVLFNESLKVVGSGAGVEGVETVAGLVKIEEEHAER